MANNYLGMIYQEQGFGGVASGRGVVSDKECLAYQQIGRLEGNIFHGCSRFGSYVIAGVWPKNTNKTIENNELPSLDKCKAWTPSGDDNRLPGVIMNNVDYNNVFVGQYGAGDLQYKFHSSVNNQNLIYWKETKNFQDGCSAHITDSFYEDGTLALPGGHGTFLIENTIFNNRVLFETNHHCNVGGTGVSRNSLPILLILFLLVVFNFFKDFMYANICLCEYDLGRIIADWRANSYMGCK